MFRAWAAQADRTEVRVLLAFFGIFGTVALAPMSAFGAYMLFTAPFSDALDRYHFVGWGIIGTLGLAGIISAWVRVLVPSRVLGAHPVILWTTVVGLTLGMLVGAFFVVQGALRAFTPMSGLALAAMVLGTFLVGATVGARRAL